jgi:hypothetical protein
VKASLLRWDSSQCLSAEAHVDLLEGGPVIVTTERRREFTHDRSLLK